MKNIISAIFFLISVYGLAQEDKFISTEVNLDPYVKGTLITPNSSGASPLVIMLQGSGPTDRHGNQSFMKNDALKKLAFALVEKGISTYRYDKRIMQMQRLGIKEQDIRFDDFITDAISVLEHFGEDKRFNKLIVLGHSQGSLVGMVAAKNRADAFISVAGVAQPIDSILIQQIVNQMPGLKGNAQQAFSELRESGSTGSYNPVLESIFRPSVQPFILSWMKYEPKEEISQLEIPVLLVNGSKDLQVEEAEAEALRIANPNAELVILEDMNHVLRKIEGDDLENSKSYNETGRPLHPELVDVLVKFVREVE